MCILSFIPEHAELSSDAIESLTNGGCNNPDGHGYAIATPNGIVLGKSLSLDECLDSFITQRARYPHTPALFHSRWATHGSVRVGNCHPFLVGNSVRTVVAHNGILPKAAHPKAGDDRSDTAILAAELLPRQWRRLDRPSVFKSLEQFCGRGNKLVILTTDPRYRRSHYIVNESAGRWDDLTGIWHSNSDYLWSLSRYESHANAELSVAAELELLDPTTCDLCGFRVNYLGYCSQCGTCVDCYEVQRDCECHIPESLKAGAR